MDHQVKLDAFVLEVANLEASKRELVTIELVLPNTPPEMMIVELKEFEKLIKAGKPDDVLNGAERYYGSGAASSSTGVRRGRPAGAKNKVASSTSSTSSTPSMSREQREAIRTWANDNGHSVGDRGRIAASIVSAFEEAHKV